MTRLLTLAVLLSAFFFTLSSGTYCYGIADSIKKGQQCAGGAADCQYGTYCDDSGVCSPLLDIGTACLFDRDCVAGAYCQGKNGEKICVGIAGIGETCSTDAESTKARCFDDADPHTEDLCDLTAKVCLGGRLGDTCKHNSNVNVCLGLMKCTDGVCAGIAEGGNCTSTSECLPTLFCNHASPRICQQRKQGNVGGECNDNNECVPGSYCIGPGQTRCVTEKSVKVGEFCDNQNAVCESLRCAGESCAAGSPTYVEDPYCSEREVMTCGGLMIDNGAAATCTNNPCYDLEKTFGDCIQENCQQCSDARCTDYIIDTTPGRCYMNHCDKEFSNMRACNGAGQLIGSVFVAAFVAFLASFVSKKF